MNAVVLLIAAVLASADATGPEAEEPLARALSPTLSPLRGAREVEMSPHTTPTADAEPAGWFDRSHAAISQGLLDAIGWFDDFFADEGHLEFEHNESTALVRQELRFEDRPRVAPRTELRLDLRLPQLGSRFNRLHLVVYAQSVAQEVVDRVGSLRGGAAGPAVPQAGDPGQGAAELRYDLVRALLASVDIGGGVHVQLPPGGFMRMRLRSTFGLAPRTVGRLTESAFYDTFQRLGTASHAEVEHHLTPRTLLRWDGIASVTQTSRGWEWGSEASLLRALGPSSAIGAGAGFLGHGRGGPTVDTYRVFTRWRADAFRRWIFFELEPEVAWPVEALSGERRRVLGLSFRVDVQFGASGAAPPGLPPALQGMRGTP